MRGPTAEQCVCTPFQWESCSRGWENDSGPQILGFPWPLDAPLRITVRARPFAWADAWQLPPRPIAAEQTTGPEQDIELVPYGNAKVLKISMFPVLAKAKSLAAAT